MKFDSKKIIVIFAFLIFWCDTQAMDATEKEFTQLSPVELKDYKDKLYMQFCTVQEIKKKFFENVKDYSWFYDIKVQDNDEFRPNENTESSVIIFQTSVNLPIGRWRFAELHSMRSEGDFWKSFFSKIKAKFYRSNAHMRNPNPSPSYYSYKVEKTFNGELIPELKKYQLTQEQAQALWQELKDRYEQETAKGRIP